MIKAIVNNINKTRRNNVELSNERLEKIDKEIQKLKNKKYKLIEYLIKEEGESKKATPSSFVLKNIGINTLSLDIDI
ncbi:hypothetical protein HMPREF1092_02747 [Clostridium thermobutyricum]|uniref:Uncharacterized protein n=1 Tax=Clostridium thermobutyricum TaxID=29372 RepID=N9XXC4_9CLOT|nr:hypothetical protein [Clostridium thermobutyricum]ENZ00232.1 hypothetical protein HMPREF1092_02747 [Clostridium thermobutyricum]